MLVRHASSAERLLTPLQQSHLRLCTCQRLAEFRQRLSFASQAQPNTQSGKGSFSSKRTDYTSRPPPIVQQGGPPKIVQHVGPATPPEPAAEEPQGPDTRPQVGTVLELDCQSLSSSGKGVCKTEEGFVVFVPRAIPGERLEARIEKLESASGRGIKLKTLIESKVSVKAPCPHFGECGGCSLQELAYPSQVAQKQQRAVEALQRLGKFANPERYMREAVACQHPLGYRNKVTFSCNTDVESLTKQRRSELADQPVIGLHKRDAPEELLEINECLLQDQTANQILTIIKENVPELQSTGRMAVSKIIIRQGTSPKSGETEYMVILHTTVRPAANPKPRAEQALKFIPMVNKIRETVPSLMSFYDCQTVVGREKAFPTLTLAYGADAMTHIVNGIAFRTLPNSFFQVNTKQAGILVDMVFKAAALERGDTLTDLFCGVGLLGVSLAKRMLEKKQPLKFLYGYEVYNQAVANARTNALHAGLMKKKGFLMKSADLSQPTLGVPINTDVVICDPARAGLGDSVIDFLFRCKARTLVYVACDLATQDRDLKALCDTTNKRHFTLESVQLCDMFPQTSHVESVAVLRRQVTWTDDRQKNAYVKMSRVRRDEFIYDKSSLKW